MRVTATLNAVPVQEPAVGVTLYVAVTGDEVVFTRLSVIEPPDPAPELPENPEPVGALHVYEVPDGMIPPDGVKPTLLH